MSSGNSYNRLTAGGSGISTSTSTSGNGATGPTGPTGGANSATGPTGEKGATGPTGGTDVFKSNITMSLPLNGGTFGKYKYRDVISAIGKTPQEVILDALREQQDPVPSITFSPLTIPFNSGSATIVITITQGILNQGATTNLANQTLNWKNANGTYNNTALTITDPAPNTASHTVTSVHDIVLTAFRTEGFKYLYTIKENQSTVPSTKEATLQIKQYEEPNVVWNQTFSDDREIGNINVDISYTITKKSDNVQLSSTKISFQDDKNTLNYSPLRETNITASPHVQTFQHNPNYTTNDVYPAYLRYKVELADTYTIQTKTIYYKTINFYPYIYYGAVLGISDIVTAGDSILVGGTNIAPVKIKNLKSKILNNNLPLLYIDTNDVTNANKVFVIAMPSPKSLSGKGAVLDTSDQNRQLGDNFTKYTCTITNTYETISTTYNVYICTIAAAYSNNHIFKIIL